MPTKRILVDGYNVIRRTPRWNDLFRRDMAAARSALLQHCATMKTRHRVISEIVVIFDGNRRTHFASRSCGLTKCALHPP